MAIRRVVTGHDDNGKAVFTSDETVEPLTGGISVLWADDAGARFPNDGAVQDQLTTFFPPVGGCRFGVVAAAPDSAPPPADFDPAEAARIADEKLPGLAAHMEPDVPGMHTSATQDFGVIVSGRIILELDDGATTELGPGDVYVQNGTRHRWLNPFDEPCVFIAVMRGADHNGVASDSSNEDP